MKSIKPGRGPSAMGAIGSLFAALFGIFWTITAYSMGAPVFFVLFGVLFVILGLLQALYQYKNATGKNRFSAYDITDGREEPDPWAEHFSQTDPTPSENPLRPSPETNYCPHCGVPVEEGFAYCPKCGSELP